MVDLIIDGFLHARALMDGGSRINIIVHDTLAKMGISKSGLGHSPTGFHGFVPGTKVQLLGKLDQEVVFGDQENF